MKLLLTVCLLLSGTSQASTTPAPLTQLENGVSHAIVTATPSAQEYAKSKKAKIQLLPKRAQRLLTKKPSAPGSAEVPDGTDSEDLDLQTAYRRPRIVTDDADELPKHVQSRLDQARKLALAKYRETWA